jgi:hypothetical protein
VKTGPENNKAMSGPASPQGAKPPHLNELERQYEAVRNSNPHAALRVLEQAVKRIEHK